MMNMNLTSSITDRVRRLFKTAITLSEAEDGVRQAEAEFAKAADIRDHSDHPRAAQDYLAAQSKLDAAKSTLDRAKERQAKAEAIAADKEKHDELARQVKAMKSLPERLAPHVRRVLAMRNEALELVAKARIEVDAYNREARAIDKLAAELGLDNCAPPLADAGNMRGVIGRSLEADCASRGLNPRDNPFGELGIT